MRYWIVPSNDHTFRIGDAIKAQNGMADWRTDKFSVGDVVFIYKIKPDQCIRYKMEVVKIDIFFDEALEQEPFWTDKDQYYGGITSIYARMKLLEEFKDDILSLHHLHEHGYQGIPRSVREIKDNFLIDFLLHPYQMVNEDVYDVDYPEDDEKLYEGALVKVMANKYERNQKARKECVEKKGYQCLVCGKDFEATYGEIGKGFIHVHHLVPISSIGKEYELNVETDLVPVCPNCHYMLHRKDPPFTIEELKEKLAKQKALTEEKSKHTKKAKSIWLRSEVNMLINVDDDAEVRKLIHNLMALYEGTSILKICAECMKEFQEKYFSMRYNDWLVLISEYVRKVTDNPSLKEEEIFNYQMIG